MARHRDVGDAQVWNVTPSTLVTIWWMCPLRTVTEVESSDQHTVKPWFAGHADVSPAVTDFPPQGYRLVGARTDYLDQQRVAVVVYQHGARVINVFAWRARRGVRSRDTTRNGCHMVFWTDHDLQ